MLSAKIMRLQTANEKRVLPWFLWKLPVRFAQVPMSLNAEKPQTVNNDMNVEMKHAIILRLFWITPISDVFLTSNIGSSIWQ
jgi:hypothetical protein